MTLKKHLVNFILSLPIISEIIRVSRKLVLPGFDGIPLYDVAVFFFNGLTKGYITSRAAAISYSVFLAIFPFLIFLFSIIPFIPVDDFQPLLLGIIHDFIPQTAYNSVEDTIVDIVTRPRSSILILNLLLTLYFSTNGVNSLIEAFNNTYHDLEIRSGIHQYFISFCIVMINSLLLITAIGLMTFGSTILLLIFPEFLMKSGLLWISLQLLRWLIILSLILMAISIVYYLAPAKRKNYRFFSPGSLLATSLIICSTLGFSFYVDNFSSYNALYGSLGTLMIVLFWIYLNAISLLVGFELNASILTAKK